MIYNFFYIDPFLIALVICPIIAFGIGYLIAWLGKPLKIALIISFLLPLVYITGNLATFKANIDAWLLWGMVYVGIAFISGKIATKFTTRNR